MDTYYARFLLAHHAAHPELASSSYDDQLAALMAAWMGTSDAYSNGLGALGHVAVELVTNDAALHRAWAREHGPTVPRGTAIPGPVGAVARRVLAARVLGAQLDAFAPDVVYVQDMFALTRRQLDAQRARGRMVAGQIASPPPAAERLQGYDLIVTSFPHFVARFEAQGVRSAYLPLAFDERLLAELPAGEPPEHQVVFVGGVGARGHAAGTALLERLSTRLPLEVWGYGAEQLRPGSPLRERHRGEAWGLEMLRVLARSRVCLNRHIDVAGGHANNMRMFEATGAGTLLCTEAAPNLSELFTPGREVLAYEDEDDLVEQVGATLEDEPGRRRIAAAGHARTLGEHTYARRMAELAELLERVRAERRGV